MTEEWGGRKGRLIKDLKILSLLVTFEYCFFEYDGFVCVCFFFLPKVLTNPRDCITI